MTTNNAAWRDLLQTQQQVEQLAARAERHLDSDCDCLFCVEVRGAVSYLGAAVKHLSRAAEYERDPDVFGPIERSADDVDETAGTPADGGDAGDTWHDIT